MSEHTITASADGAALQGPLYISDAYGMAFEQCLMLSGVGTTEYERWGVPQRAYIVEREAWYGKHLSVPPGVAAQISVIVRGDVEHPDADRSLRAHNSERPVDGAFQLCWYSQPGGVSALRIEAFDDAFRALALCPDLLAELVALMDGKASRVSATVPAVRMLLDRLGFVDITPRTAPGATAEPSAEGAVAGGVDCSGKPA